MDKDLDPAVLKAIVADREHRIAVNRLRELEEKKAKLLQHDHHSRLVQERKAKLAGEQLLGSIGDLKAGASSAPRPSWGSRENVALAGAAV